MNDQRKTSKPPALFWDEQGRVSCAEHAPYRGTDTWHFDGWRRMRPSNIAAFAAESGMAVECEVCGPRAAGRRARWAGSR